jgi:hypothetical protein
MSQSLVTSAATGAPNAKAHLRIGGARTPKLKAAKPPMRYVDNHSASNDAFYMTINIVTTIRTTTTPPYTQLRPDRIEIQERHGMLLLPKIAELQEKQPQFWDALQRNNIRLRSDPVQLDAALLQELRNKVGVRIETDGIEFVAALLNLNAHDPIFYNQ